MGYQNNALPQTDKELSKAKQDADERVRKAIMEADSRVSDANNEVALHKTDVERLTRERDAALNGQKHAIRETTAAKQKSREDLQNAQEDFTRRLTETQQQISRAQADAEHQSAELTFAKADKELAEESLQRARQQLEQVQNSQRDLEIELHRVNGLLDEVRASRNVAEEALQSVRSELVQRRNSLNLANNEIAEVKNELNHESQLREQAQAASRASEKLLALKTKQQDRLQEKADNAQRDNEAAQTQLRTEISKRETSERHLNERRDLEDQRSQRDEEIIDEVRGKLKSEREEHTKRIEELRSLRRQSSATEMALKRERQLLEATRAFLRGQVEGLEKDAETQHQAVAGFLKHGFSTTAVVAPSVQEMVMLHSKCEEPTASNDIPGLPVIVVACGRLPASWSYLSFASAGVLLNSRFNQQIITAAVSTELPYIHDALVRVIKAVGDEDNSADVRRTLIVVLQGIAYVYLAAKLSPGMLLQPPPSALLDSLNRLDQGEGSVIGMMYKRVYHLVHRDAMFSSWLFDEFTGERLDSTKTGLPKEVVMIHQDTPDIVFMARSATKQQLFVIDEDAITFDYLSWESVKMRLPVVDGMPNNLRQMDLMTKAEHGGVLAWASSISKRQSSNM